MRNHDGVLHLSATDLTGHLSCAHLTALDAAVARGTREKPGFWDPLGDILRARGNQHEQAYLDHLQDAGYEIVQISDIGLNRKAADETAAAMRDGAAIISQGVLLHERWGGRADILRRIETPSELGPWSYEVIDTKLARETSGASILQLCLYADLVARVQGVVPEFVNVVVPWSDFEPQRYRTSDFFAYYRLVRQSLETSVASGNEAKTYPDPKLHCDICRWRRQCDARRRSDDHLCLVAGSTKLQIKELQRRGIDTVEALADMPLPLQWKPERGAAQTYERLREQARVQVAGRNSGEPVYEALEPEAGFGLARLPAPSAGDVLFDLEGDPFCGEGGLEYLFGWVNLDLQGRSHYTARWALSREEEKSAFEAFVDYVNARWRQHPDMHVYHFGGYEPGALKRLMGRYATREEDIDRMLRAGMFVDLLGVVRGGIRASVEGYSLKDLEQFHGFRRDVDLPDANHALAHVQACLETDDIEGLTKDGKSTVQGYNRDDCNSTRSLRDWLENVRTSLIAEGASIDRPAFGEGDPSAAISEWQQKIDLLNARLTADVPVDIEDRTTEQQARWILANIADWHRREDKSVWWEYFRLSELSADDLLDERGALSGLEYVETVGGTLAAPMDRYRFPAQETDLRDGMALRSVGGGSFGRLEKIAFGERTVDIRKSRAAALVYPPAVFAHDYVNAKVLAHSLLRIAVHVAMSGIVGDGGKYRVARDLLLRERPRTGGAPLRLAGETTVESAVRIAPLLQGGVLPIQGPPGAGKTYTGARMICALVAAGARVGITATSHKVIRNLLDEVLKAAEETRVRLSAVQKVSKGEENIPRLQFTTSNPEVFKALGYRCQVAGGTAWLWSRREAEGAVDVLVVDEAAQMSLANVLAISHAGAGLVLLGDPQQLEQPIQGSHPDGTAVSALDHILAGHQTIPDDRGLFLEQTWRLHPKISEFTSEMFYEGRLESRPGLENQRIVSNGPIRGSGLRFAPVEHDGNQSSSPEEAEAVSALVRRLLDEPASWIDRYGNRRPLAPDDILIIAPYNAQVFELQQRLPGARIGTVDKFQGQQAPVVFYSMATSTPAEAPHGMEFLYSLNRFNVATSRARCLSVLVANPALFSPECRTPRQMKLANAFCRYQELSETVRKR
ncbi:MAG: TM0106 family RecB-like putative nuclease [Rhodospirillaceae bacterium]|nr:TM0106 family RecB-like putative nuclease [Rhodospirillaceae bacterium]